MAVNVQGPLAVGGPKGKAAATNDAGAGALNDAAPPRSFAEVLAAAQPADEAVPTTRPEGRDDDARANDRVVDAPPDVSLPPWLVPSPAIDVAREIPIADRGFAKSSDVSLIRDASPTADVRTVPLPGAGRPLAGDRAAAASDGIEFDAVPADAGAAASTDDVAPAFAAPTTSAAVPAAADDTIAAVAQALTPVAGSDARMTAVAPTKPGSQSAPAAKRAPEPVAEGVEDAPPSTTPAAADNATSVRRNVPPAPTTAVAARTTNVASEAPDRPAPHSALQAAASAAPAAPVAASASDSSAPAQEIEHAPAAVGAGAATDAPPVALAAAAARDTHRGGEPVAVAVERTVGSAGWNQEVTTAITHLISGRHASAQLHLHPESMGPVDVRISVSGGEASVQLVASHAATREALAEALPMLRDLLGSQGLALGQAAVESRAQQDRSAPSPPPQSQATPEGAGRAPAGVADTPASVARVLRLLDVFA